MVIVFHVVVVVVVVDVFVVFGVVVLVVVGEGVLECTEFIESLDHDLVEGGVESFVAFVGEFA